MEQTKVGDRYVLERMREIGASLGGEQSGHIIFLDENTTGDGLLSALHLLEVMVDTEEAPFGAGEGYDGHATGAGQREGAESQEGQLYGISGDRKRD